MYLGSTIFTDSPLLAREVAEPHLDDLALLRSHGVAHFPQGVEVGARGELRQPIDQYASSLLLPRRPLPHFLLM